MDVKPRHIHKTLLENFDHCERFAYLKNYWNPPHDGDEPLHGVTQPSSDPSRVIGGAIHAGVSAVAMGADPGGGTEMAVAAYDEEVKEFDVHKGLLKDHHTLIEAGVRIWAAVQLPIIKARYKIVEAEQTIFMPLTQGLTAITRPDILLQDTMDGRFVNYSLKTEKAHGYIKHPTALIDLGGTLECASIAFRMGGLEKVAGTWMTYIVVGDTKGKVDPQEGMVVWHPGVRGWRRQAAERDYYAWKWEYDNPEYDPLGPKDSRKNPKSRSLSAKDGWERFHATQHPQGVAGWVAGLVEGEYSPTNVDPTKELVLSPEVYTRGNGHLESFLTEVVTKQTQVSNSLVAVAAGEDIDAHFPKRRSSCMKFANSAGGGRCEMWKICWEGAGRDPFAYGYVPRKSSLDKKKEKGLIVEEI